MKQDQRLNWHRVQHINFVQEPTSVLYLVTVQMTSQLDANEEIVAKFGFLRKPCRPTTMNESVQ